MHIILTLDGSLYIVYDYIRMLSIMGKIRRKVAGTHTIYWVVP